MRSAVLSLACSLGLMVPVGTSLEVRAQGRQVAIKVIKLGSQDPVVGVVIQAGPAGEYRSDPTGAEGVTLLRTNARFDRDYPPGDPILITLQKDAGQPDWAIVYPRNSQAIVPSATSLLPMGIELIERGDVRALDDLRATVALLEHALEKSGPNEGDVTAGGGQSFGSRDDATAAPAIRSDASDWPPRTSQGGVVPYGALPLYVMAVAYLASTPATGVGQGTQVPRDHGELDPKLQGALEETASQFGFSPLQLHEAILRWSESAEAPYELGLSLLYAGDYSAARVELSDALADAAERADIAAAVDAATFLGHALYNEGRYSEAAETYRRAVALRLGDPLLLNYLRIALVQAARYEEPEILMRYVTLESVKEDFFRVIVWLGNPELTSEQRETFGEDVTNVRWEFHGFEDPFVDLSYADRPWSWAQLAFVEDGFDLEVRITLEDGSIVELEEEIDLEEREPVDDAEKLALAYLLGREERGVEAIQLVDEVLDTGAPFFATNHPTFVILGRAHVAEMMNAEVLQNPAAARQQADEAVDAFETAIELDPQAPAALNAYSQFVVQMLDDATDDQLRKALNRARSAQEIQPDPEYLDTMGWAHYRLEEDRQALELLAEARTLLQDTGEDHAIWLAVNYHLGMVFLRMDDDENAEDAFQAVLNYEDRYPGADPEFPDAARRELNRLRRQS